MKTIGIVTSGGDAPGMNAAIRAIVRTAYSKNFQVLGFKEGWEGLLTNNYKRLNPRSVSGIMHLGGTILHTSRCLSFRKKEGIIKASRTLASNNIDGLIVIGGNGSMKGALELSKETQTSIVGIPASIDNDVFGTDETIGFDSAVNTAVTNIDKIRDTAISLDRIFVIEVMGRTRGILALMIGFTVGAEIILIPEVKYEKKEIFRILDENIQKGKQSGIIIAAEGIGDTQKLSIEIGKQTGKDTRLSVIGYAQRGGNPTARSRFLAGLFAYEAVELISKNQSNKVIGLQNGVIKSLDLEKSCNTEKSLDMDLFNLANILSK